MGRARATHQCTTHVIVVLWANSLVVRWLTASCCALLAGTTVAVGVLFFVLIAALAG